MIVLKVQSEAVTSSFRYPRIQIGTLPTSDMPPPATIYGHLAGVLGEWFEPDGLEFCYVFQHGGKATDLETGQPLEKGSGKHSLKKRGWNYPVNVECAPNPQRREFLLNPRMTLYLRGHEELLGRLRGAFHSPAFTYILGRSQDLAVCHSAAYLEIGESEEAFFSHTLLPYDWRPWISPGTTVYMPSSIDYRQQRAGTQTRYLQVMWPPAKIYSGSGDTINRPALPPVFPVDSTDQREFSVRTLARGLWFHRVGVGG